MYRGPRLLSTRTERVERCDMVHDWTPVTLASGPNLNGKPGQNYLAKKKVDSMLTGGPSGFSLVLMKTDLVNSRRRVTQKLAGVELPSCWVSATIASAVQIGDRKTQYGKASRKRLLSKALKVVGAL